MAIMIGVAQQASCGDRLGVLVNSGTLNVARNAHALASNAEAAAVAGGVIQQASATTVIQNATNSGAINLNAIASATGVTGANAVAEGSGGGRADRQREHGNPGHCQ